MLARQKKLIQDTWTQVAPIADQAAAIFYQRLFEIDPSTRTLFNTTDMVQQRKKLVQILSVAVSSLDNLGALGKTIEDLGLGTPVMASRTRTMTPSVWRCSGRLSRGLAPHGRPKPPAPGRRSTDSSPASCATPNRRRAPKRLRNYLAKKLRKFRVNISG
jgi:hypothetical protein